MNVSLCPQALLIVIIWIPVLVKEPCHSAELMLVMLRQNRKSITPVLSFHYNKIKNNVLPITLHPYRCLRSLVLWDISSEDFDLEEAELLPYNSNRQPW